MDAIDKLYGGAFGAAEIAKRIRTPDGNVVAQLARARVRLFAVAEQPYRVGQGRVVGGDA